MKNLVIFDLRFGFLVKNCIYSQNLVKIWSKSSQIIKELRIFVNLNLGLFPLSVFRDMLMVLVQKTIDGPGRVHGGSGDNF